jgi:hypothetical protein
VGQLLDANVTESPTWKLANGDCFEPRLLALYRESRWIPVGIAALKVTPGQSLSPIRRAHIDSLCNAFLDSGDVGGGQRAPGLDP